MRELESIYASVCSRFALKLTVKFQLNSQEDFA